MKKDDEKKTALKLLNKYAESYAILEIENKHLKAEIYDLKINLKINKEIITKFFQKNTKNDKSTFYVNKLREEMNSMQSQLEKIEKENEDLKTQLCNTEQIMSANLTRDKNEIEKLLIKIFLLENVIIKKESLINSYSKKITKIHSQTYIENKSNNKTNEREIFIVDPQIAINQINDELIMYKTIYQVLIKNVNDLENNLIKYKKVNSDLEIELENLKKKITQNNKENNSKYKTNENITMTPNTPKTVFNIKFDDKEFSKTENDNSIIKNKNNSFIESRNNLKLNILKQYENYEENNRVEKEKVKEDITDEWIDILKNNGLTQQEFVNLAKNKSNTKLIDALEYLYKMVIDKNMEIKILITEIEELHQKNFTLNKENIDLCEQMTNLNKKNECKNCNQKSKINIVNIYKSDKGLESSILTKINKISVQNEEELIMKNMNTNDRYRNNVMNTFESVTSSEFQNGMNKSFVSSENNVEIFVDVKHIKNYSN